MMKTCVGGGGVCTCVKDKDLRFDQEVKYM